MLPIRPFIPFEMQALTKNRDMCQFVTQVVLYPWTWEQFFGLPLKYWQQHYKCIPLLRLLQEPKALSIFFHYKLFLSKAVDLVVLHFEERYFVVSLLKRISQCFFSRGLPLSWGFQGPPASCSPWAQLLPKWHLSCQSCTFEGRGTFFVLTPCTLNYCLSVAFNCACELRIAWLLKLEDCPHVTTQTQL